MAKPLSARQQIETLENSARRQRTAFDAGTVAWRHWPATEATNETVVLFHGGFGSWMHWVRNIESLQRRYNVLALDLPGLGDSDPPSDPITPASIGAIVAHGLDALAPKSDLHFVAFSFGGVVAGQTALTLRRRLRSLTLVGASGMGLARHRLLLVRRTAHMTEQQRRDANIENLKRLLIANVENVDDLAIWIHHTNDQMARLRSRNMSFGDSLARALPTLASADVALNGIWGSRDVTAAPWIFHRRELLRQHCERSRFAIIEGAGHWVAYEAAQRFNQTLLDFLSDGAESR